MSTKKELKNETKKKLIIMISFMIALMTVSTIATITILNLHNNNELSHKEGNILYYSENKKQEEEENSVLIVGIDEKNNMNNQKETNEKEQNESEIQKKANIPYYIKVNKQANVVTIYKKDSKGNYTVPVKAMLCSTGEYTPSCNKYPKDTYQTTGYKKRWNYLQGDVYGQYATQIVGNILFHSIPYQKEDASTLEYWEYDKLGTSASAGCIRLTVEDAKWIFDNISKGTTVEFYSSSNPGPLGKPTAKKISNDEEVRNWDPTDQDKNNPWAEYLKRKEEEKMAQEASTKPVESEMENDITNNTENTETNVNIINENNNTTINENTNVSTNLSTDDEINNINEV